LIKVINFGLFFLKPLLVLSYLLSSILNLSSHFAVVFSDDSFKALNFKSDPLHFFKSNTHLFITLLQLIFKTGIVFSESLHALIYTTLGTLEVLLHYVEALVEIDIIVLLVAGLIFRRKIRILNDLH